MAQAIIERVRSERVSYVPYDSYYKELDQIPVREGFRNFDHPDALDTPLLVQHLTQLRAGQPVEIPTYDFTTFTRLSETQHIEARKVIIVEGILALADETLRSQFDERIFVDLDADLRYIRRLDRDVNERGRTVESVKEQYLATVRPMHEQFVEPSKKYASFVVSGEGDQQPSD